MEYRILKKAPLTRLGSVRRLSGVEMSKDDPQILCRRCLGEREGMRNKVLGRWRESFARFKVERESVVKDLKGNHFDSNIGAFEREVKSKLQRIFVSLPRVLDPLESMGKLSDLHFSKVSPAALWRKIQSGKPCLGIYWKNPDTT